MGVLCCKESVPDLNAEVELGHFHLLRSVGKGAFGKVRIVQHKRDKKLYALKYINKLKCIKMKAIENIIQERKILEDVQHPFICNLRFAFQDDENLFMILDLMLGGDMRFHLERMGTFTEEMVRLYVAEISAALAYLHQNNIVHRDLKPDNILLCERGHAHLTDFNIAVRFKPEKPLTAVAGSMAYMAPEILAKKGYFSSIDWWSLGVIMYEVLFGRRPFRGKTNEALTHAIQHEDLHIPDSKLSMHCITFMRALLTRNIHNRLGTQESGGFGNIKLHPFLKDIDWAKLEQKEITPQFVPDSKKANFDATHELEELLLEDNPLRVKTRKKRITEDEDAPIKPGEDPVLAKGMRAMEKRFNVFDYSKPKVDQATVSQNSAQRDGPDPPKHTESGCLSLHTDVMEGRDHEVNMIGVERASDAQGASPDERQRVESKNSNQTPEQRDESIKSGKLGRDKSQDVKRGTSQMADSRTRNTPNQIGFPVSNAPSTPSLAPSSVAGTSKQPSKAPTNEAANHHSDQYERPEDD